MHALGGSKIIWKDIISTLRRMLDDNNLKKDIISFMIKPDAWQKTTLDDYVDAHGGSVIILKKIVDANFHFTVWSSS